MPNLGVFGLKCPQNCLIPKFDLKIKILKFGTKNALFGYFWAGI